MEKITNNIFVGSDLDCFDAKPGWAVVHACKVPCHRRAVGYVGNLPASHSNYLFLVRGENLYLNMIDPPVPLFRPLLFATTLEFVGRHMSEGKNILIHCNRGESRAPTLALIVLAKRLHLISAESYDLARQEFTRIYPHYYPGRGIQSYLAEAWDDI